MEQTQPHRSLLLSETDSVAEQVSAEFLSDGLETALCSTAGDKNLFLL